MPGMHPWQYFVSWGRNVLYPPNFDKIVIKLPAELMYMVQPLFAVQARHQGRQRENDIVLILHEL